MRINWLAVIMLAIAALALVAGVTGSYKTVIAAWKNANKGAPAGSQPGGTKPSDGNAGDTKMPPLPPDSGTGHINQAGVPA